MVFIREMMAGVYTVLSNKIRVDRCSCFRDDFHTIVNGAMIDIARSGIEAHSSLEIGERFPQPFKNKFRRAKISMMSHIPDSTILAICVKATNDTLGPERFVPSALVRGVFPSTQVFKKPRDPKQTLQQRAQLASSIHAEMEEGNGYPLCQ